MHQIPEYQQIQRIIRKPELIGLIGLSDTTIWRMERSGKFPKRITLGGKSTGWLASEVQEWIDKKASERG